MKKIILSVTLICNSMLLANDEVKQIGLGLALSFVTNTIDDAIGIIGQGVFEKDLSPRAQRLYKDCKSDNTSAISSCDELSIMFSQQNGVPCDKYDVDDHLINCDDISAKFSKIALEKTWKNCKSEDIKSCDNWLERYDDLRLNSSQYSSNISYAKEKACRGGMPKHCHSLGQSYENDSAYKKAIEFYSIGCDYVHEESCERLQNLQ